MMSRIKTFLYGFALIALAAVVTSQQPPPAKAQQTGSVYCSQSAIFDGTGQNRVIIGVNANRIFICGYDVTSPTAQIVQLKTGTGSNCGTGTANLSPAWNIGVGTSNFGFGNFAGIGPVPPLIDVCFTSAATAEITIYYSQQ